jgi:hypothetical protein
MEGWKDGRVEGWKGGRMEEWKNSNVPPFPILPFFRSPNLPILLF